MTVTERRRLLNELEPARVSSRRRGKGGLIARKDDHANLLDPCLQNFFDDDAQRGFLRAIAVHQSLERKRALIFASGGDDRFFDFHTDVRARPASQNFRPPFKIKTAVEKSAEKN